MKARSMDNFAGRMQHRLAATLFATLFMLACIVSNASAQNFVSSQFHTATAPSGVKSADINKDGHQDLVLISTPPGSTSSLVVHLGKGDGTFGAPLTFAAQLHVAEFEVVDVNHDGKADLAYVGDDKLGVMIGNGDGTFGAPQLFQGTAGQSLNSLGTADFDKDGNADFVASSDVDLEFFYGNGDGTVKPVRAFALPASPDTQGPVHGTNAEAGDIDGDGFPDVVFTLNGNLTDPPVSSIFVWYGDAGGNFSDRRLIDRGSEAFFGVKINDLNKDGHPDISGHFDGCMEGCVDGVFVYFFSGNRTFTHASQSVFSTNSGSSIDGGPTFADFNGDGNQDLLILGCESDGQTDECLEHVAQIFPMNFNTFAGGSQLIDVSAGQDHATGQDAISPSEIIAADFDGDGRADFAVTEQGTDTIAIFMNKNGTTTVHQCSPSSTPSATETICSIHDGGTFSSPVPLVSTPNIGTAETTSVYVDGVKQHSSAVPDMNTALAMAAGTHQITVKSWNLSGTVVASSTIHITVGTGGGTGGGGGACSAPSSAGNNTVTICSPANGASVTSPVQISAAAKSTSKITAMKVYVDGVSKFSQTTGPTLGASLTMQPGKHHITVKAWVGSTSFSRSVDITVH